MKLKPLLAAAEQLIAEGSLASAINIYRRILATEGCPVEVNLRLGALYHKQGQTRAAMRHYQIVADHFRDGPVKLAALRQMVKIEPGQPTHRLRLAELYRKGGNQRLAIKEYAKAAEQLAYTNVQSPELGRIIARLTAIMPNNASLLQELTRLRAAMEPTPSAPTAPLPVLASLETVVEFGPVEARKPLRFGRRLASVETQGGHLAGRRERSSG